jgi:hypothetical protein
VGDAPSDARERPPGAALALGFALAAAAASWNPFAAPLGLVVGIAAGVQSWRALRRARGPQRRIPAAALGLSLLAVVGSATVLATTAGTVGVELPGQPVLKARTPQELDQTLTQAAERTRAQRERARAELERLTGGASGARRAPGGGPDGGPSHASPDAK